MQSCFRKSAVSMPCTASAGHAVHHQRPLAAAAATGHRVITVQLLHQQPGCLHTIRPTNSSSSRQQLPPSCCQAAAGDDASAEDVQQQQQQQCAEPQQQPRSLDSSSSLTYQHQQQQHQQQQFQQQQHQQQQFQQQRQYQQLSAATMVSTTWGMAERRAHLAALVRAADSVDGLAAVWVRCRAAAGPAELTVLFNRLAAVCEPRKMSVKGWNNAKALLRELLLVSEDKMPLMAGPEFVYIIAALAKLRAAPDQAWLNRWLAVSRHKLGLLQPAQLVMCVRALCRLDMQPGDVKGCIAFPAWMHNFLAALPPRLPACSGFDLTKLLRALADLGYKPARPFLAEFAAAVEPKLATLDSIHLAALMGSFSALKYEPEPAFMRAFYAEVYQKLPMFDDQDLATALCAFSSMRRLMKGDFLAEFLAEVAEKLPTFGTPALASVLGALGRLGYKPGEAWTAKVADHLESRLVKANIHVLSTSAWGLASCGHIPTASFVEELLTASTPRLTHMEANEALMLAQALAKFQYNPEAGSPGKGQRLWVRWWQCYGNGVEKRTLHPRQVLEMLEAFRACGVTPQAQTVDHLVLQLVQGGLQHAPATGVARLLQLLGDSQHTPGPLFVKLYAKCVRLVSGSLSAAQIAGAIQALAQQAYKPASWWLVQILAGTHARVTEFDSTAAAAMLWAAAKLSQHSRLPSEKWTADFSVRFWEQLDSLTAQQLSEGLWGAVAVGFKPSDEQWVAWEAAAAALSWQLQLQQARFAVEAFRKAKRAVPEPLLQQLQQEFEKQKAVREAEVAAVEAARQQAAAALVAQQHRAAAAIAAHRARQQVLGTNGAVSHSSSDGENEGVRQSCGNSKNRRKQIVRAAAAAAKAGKVGGNVLVVPQVGAAPDNDSNSLQTATAVAAA